MQGLLITENGNEFIFRDDIAADFKYFGWLIREPDIGWRVPTHKWNKLPRGKVVLFNLDNPPATVPYLPILG